MPRSMLIFGITGDLIRLKGLPALFALWKQHTLPHDFKIIGLSRKKWDNEEFRAQVVSLLSKKVAPDEAAEFARIISMVEGEAGTPGGYDALKKALGTERNFLMYLCVSPDFFEPIIRELGADGFLTDGRILIEKPFGFDIESARVLQKLLLSYMDEERIYRIDHFLAKEAMAELSSFPSEEVTSIEIYLNEAFGVDARGAMYDPVGALRDVGQNHLLESAAVILGDRAFALESLHILSPEEIMTHTRRAQHEGYREIAGVAPNSQTETFFSIESHFKWGGRSIPLLIESGKHLPSRREAVVTLEGGERVIPFESSSNEYETLFEEALAGDRSRFVSMREVEALWRFIDPIEKEWKSGRPPLLSYPPGADPLSRA